MTKLDTATAQVRIYIPQGKVRNTFIRRLVEVAGGCTEVPVYGTYVDAQGKIIREPIIRVEAWFSNTVATEVFELIAKETRRLHNAGESAVLTEFFTAAPDEGATLHFAKEQS